MKNLYLIFSFLCLPFPFLQTHGEELETPKSNITFNLPESLLLFGGLPFATISYEHKAGPKRTLKWSLSSLNFIILPECNVPSLSFEISYLFYNNPRLKGLNLGPFLKIGYSWFIGDGSESFPFWVAGFNLNYKIIWRRFSFGLGTGVGLFNTFSNKNANSDLCISRAGLEIGVVFY